MTAFWKEMKIAPCLMPGCPNCGYDCFTYHSLHSLYKEAKIPKHFLGETKLKPDRVDLESFQILENFKRDVWHHVEQGHGLFLISETRGNGKTTWALKILKRYLQMVAIEYDLGMCAGLYVNVPTLMKRLKDAIDEPDEELNVIKRRLSTVPLVVWDDIGREKASDYSREVLYASINERYENDLSQIFTSNKPTEELSKKNVLGREITSRIAGQCMPVMFKGDDRRRDSAWWNTK